MSFVLFMESLCLILIINSQLYQSWLKKSFGGDLCLWSHGGDLKYFVKSPPNLNIE